MIGYGFAGMSAVRYLLRSAKILLCITAFLFSSLSAVQAMGKNIWQTVDKPIPLACNKKKFPIGTARKTNRSNILQTDDGKDIPFYIIKFDKQGRFESDEDRRLSQEISTKSSEYSDIFFFSHGWNNDWKTARKFYLNFFKQYYCLHQKKGLDMPADFKPMLVTVYWPATWFTFGPGARGPKANKVGMPFDDNYSQKEFRENIELIQSEIDDESKQKKIAQLLKRRDRLYAGEAQKLAEFLAPIFTDIDDNEMNLEGKTINSQDLLDDWKKYSAENNKKSRNKISLKDILFFPRNIIRYMSFAVMRKRAGIIGRGGAREILQDLLDQSQARIHLVGHSYGSKVVLSALNNTRDNSRKAHSILLLQPAISYQAFESKILCSSCKPEYKSGAYHPVFNKVQAPILSTYSKHDEPLHDLFHLAMRSIVHIGESDDYRQKRQEPPISEYAALGGYGPKSSPLSDNINIKDVHDYYPLGDKMRLYGLNGSKGTIPTDRKITPIGGHGDISNNYTAWALYNLVRYPAKIPNKPVKH